MQGDSRIYALLDTGISHEIAVVAMYMLDHVIQQVSGYKKLAAETETRAKGEMHHAKALMARAVFLNYKPVVDKMDPFVVEPTLPEQVRAEAEKERAIIQVYNDAVKVCMEVGDDGSRALFENILKDEEGHLEELEAHITQLGAMGTPSWLQAQL